MAAIKANYDKHRKYKSKPELWSDWGTEPSIEAAGPAGLVQIGQAMIAGANRMGVSKPKKHGTMENPAGGGCGSGGCGSSAPASKDEHGHEKSGGGCGCGSGGGGCGC